MGASSSRGAGGAAGQTRRPSVGATSSRGAGGAAETRRPSAERPTAEATHAAPTQIQCYSCRGLMNVPRITATASVAVQCPYCQSVNGIRPGADAPPRAAMARVDMDSWAERERRRNREEGQAFRAPRRLGLHGAGGAQYNGAAFAQQQQHPQMHEFPDELVQRLQQIRHRMHPAEMLLVREVLEHLQATGQGAPQSLGASSGMIDRLTSEWTMDAKGTTVTGNCTICLEDFEGGQKMRTLPCFHSFHAACVEEWLGKSRACPNCQFDIVAAANSAQETFEAEPGAAPAT